MKTTILKFYETNQKKIQNFFTKEEFLKISLQCVKFIQDKNIDIDKWNRLWHRALELQLSQNPYFYTYPDIKNANNEIRKMHDLYKNIIFIESYPEFEIEKEEIWTFKLFLSIRNELIQNVNLISKNWTHFPIIMTWIDKHRPTLYKLDKTSDKPLQVANISKFIRGIFDILAPLWKKNHFGVHQKQRFIDKTKEKFELFSRNENLYQKETQKHFENYDVENKVWEMVFENIDNFDIIMDFPVDIFIKEIKFEVLMALASHFNNFEILNWWYNSLERKENFEKMYPYIIKYKRENNKYLIKKYLEYGKLFSKEVNGVKLIKQIIKT